MELRQLTTEYERKIFGECLEKARITSGIGFNDTPHSRLATAHLMLADAYAIFADDGEPVERMVGGFIVHDLGTLPQSFSKPDLSHLPAESVIEGGELWSLSRGTAGVARRVAAAIAGIMQAKAILLYPIVNPVDLSQPHRQVGFVEASEPVLNPFGRALDGRPLWVQPMLLQGEKLEAYIRWGFQSLFVANGDRLTLRFDKPVAKRLPATDGSVLPIAGGPASAIQIPIAAKRDEVNAAAVH